MKFANDPWVADIVQQFAMHADEEGLSNEDREGLVVELADQLGRAAEDGRAGV